MQILLKDRTTGGNIIWATDSYASFGRDYFSKNIITTRAVCNGMGDLIRPRASKLKHEQDTRTRDRAEVFTPTWVIKKQNDLIEEEFENLELNEYINKTWLEIACGEAPYIASRYDTVSGVYIHIDKRVGFLDRKIQRISKEIEDQEEWMNLVQKAYKASYGYEFQGDSLLLARENLLYTFIDYYLDKFDDMPGKKDIKEIARIISYNIFQMDGLKYTIPLSEEIEVTSLGDQLSMFSDGNQKQQVMEFIKEGTRVKIKNWENDRLIDIREKVKDKEEEFMKFDVVIGNPPYDDGSKQQIYTDFYVNARSIAENICLIFPTGWQGAKDRNNLGKMNNKEIKRDSQIVLIENIKSAFNNIPGADSTNIILWKKGYNNGLNGKQLIISGKKQEKIKLPIYKKDILKPRFIRELETLVNQDQNFESIQKIISRRKPYGLSTNILKDNKELCLPALNKEKKTEEDIRIFTPRGLRYVSKNYPFPKKGKGFKNYKVFVPYAWGNWREQVGLGGSYANIFVAQPKDACIETYLECGSYETQEKAEFLAKYMMTQFFRALLYLNKFSQHSTTAFGAIPIQKFNEYWWKLSIQEINEKLYDKYNVPEDIRKKINQKIQLRDEKNIIIK